MTNSGHSVKKKVSKVVTGRKELFGDRLNETLKLRHISQADLSSRLGISRSQVQKYIKNTVEPKLKMAMAIAAELGISYKYLYGIELPGEKNFGLRVRYLRTQDHLNWTRVDLAEYLEIPVKEVEEMEESSRVKSQAVTLKLALLHPEHDQSWVLTGRTAEEIALENSQLERPDLRLVDPKNSWFKGQKYEPGVYYPLPLISGAVAAGSPRVISEDEVDDWIPVIYNRQWCPHPEKTVCVRIAGDSMEPTIPDGGLAAIDMDQKDPANLQKKIVALRKDGGVTIKRLFLSENHYWIGRPDNLQSDEIFTFPDEEIAECIIGKVVFWWGRG